MKFKSAVALAFVMVAPATSANAELILNGNFSTGDFTGWSLFTTANGTIGSNPDPRVTSFDVTGSGSQNAAEFQVGQINFDFGHQEGGGLTQSITTLNGILQFSASIAA